MAAEDAFMTRRKEGRKSPTLDMWERVKSGEWQYGRGLALAWSGEPVKAREELEAAMERFRQRGEEELLGRAALHHEILECRCEPVAERRFRRTSRLATRLQSVGRLEDYHPPFSEVSGSRLAECLWRDLSRPEFLLEAPAEDPQAGEMAG
jgi:hypothetical protein